MELTRDEINDFLEALELGPHDVITDYEGRGPTRPCIALYLNPEVNLISVGIAAVTSLGYENARDLARVARTDSLGRDEIVYFPGWTVEGDDDE